MNNAVKIAAAAMFTAGMAFTGGFSAPSYATEAPKKHTCYWIDHHKYCPGTRFVPGTSTELFPSRCNGELGFWEDPIVFQNGETFCIARSTADFYHNGGLVPTCTVKQKVDGKWVKTTTDGACPSKPDQM